MIKHINLIFLEFKSKTGLPYFLLLIITFIAAALRFYQLGEWSFWEDEIFTISGQEDGFNYNLIRQSISLMLIQSTLTFLGTSEWSARLVPAVIGVLSIPLLYFLYRKMFGSAVALVAVLLLALSPWHLYWSQNARFYTALLLFYTLALFTFYFGIEEDRPSYLFASLIFLGLATKERLLALFFIPVVLGYLLLLKVLPFQKPPGLRLRNLAIFLVPGSIFALFFVRPYILDLSGWMAGFGYPNNSPFWILAGAIYYLGIPSICLGTFGALYLLAKKNRASLLLSLAAVIPLLAIMALSPFHYTANRYMFVCLTSWIILASFAATELFRVSKDQVKILAVGGLLFLLLHPLSEDLLYYKFQNGNRDNWKAAFELVRQQKEEGDLVLSAKSEIGEYYLQDKTISLATFDFATLEQHVGRIWFVEDMVAQQLYPELHSWLEKNAQLVANFDIHLQVRTFQMRVYLYDPAKSKVQTTK